MGEYKSGWILKQAKKKNYSRNEPEWIVIETMAHIQKQISKKTTNLRYARRFLSNIVRVALCGNQKREVKNKNGKKNAASIFKCFHNFCTKNFSN